MPPQIMPRQTRAVRDEVEEVRILLCYGVLEFPVVREQGRYFGRPFEWKGGVGV